MIHKEVLCLQSALFANVLTSDSEAARTGVVTMENIDPEVFGTLVHYIYTQRVKLDDDDDQDEIKTEEHEGNKTAAAEKVSMLADLWTLAGVCMMSGLQNESMELLFPMLNTLDGDELRDVAVRVYNKDEDSTQLRKAVSERIAFGLDEGELAQWMVGRRDGQLPPDLLIDLVLALKGCAVVGVELNVADYFVV